MCFCFVSFFFFQAEDGIRDHCVTGVQTCALPISRLVKQGFRVALCEQMEDPRTAKGVVKREVVRVITPGTQLEASALAAGETSFVLALAPAGVVGAAYLDATTGEFLAAQWDGPTAWERLRDDI